MHECLHFCLFISVTYMSRVTVCRVLVCFCLATGSNCVYIHDLIVFITGCVPILESHGI